MAWFLKWRFLAAVKAGKIGKVREFLNIGADPEWKDRGGLNALMLAAFYGHLELVNLFLGRGMDANKPTTHIAYRGEKIANHTPLMAAAGDGPGRPEIVARLLRAGAEVNELDSQGFCALMGAVSFGHTEIARLLIAAGARTDRIYGSGKNTYTLLDVARENNYTEIVELLT